MLGPGRALLLTAGVPRRVLLLLLLMNRIAFFLNSQGNKTKTYASLSQS